MGKVVVFTQSRTIDFDEYEDRPLESTEVRLQTLYSGISAGTELTAYRGSNPYIHKKWDSDRKLFLPEEQPSQSYPISGWGYEEVGQVVEVGRDVSRVESGAVVYGTWGHRSHHIVSEDYAASRIQPEGLDSIYGIFSQIGAIALNGVHDARIRIGETVAVFGLGVPGQIVAQLAKHSGAQVIGVDPIVNRRTVAMDSGAVDVAIDPAADSPAEIIKDMTAGRGADVAIEVSGHYAALHQATRAVAYSAKVVALGFFQGGAKELFLGEEFHHNRVNIVCSQIFGVDPELTYRWNRDRLVRAAMLLQTDGTLNLEPVISHVFPFDQADKAFQLLDQTPEQTLQVVLKF
jgi:2-desacetyl-2-hydroxyethyl bacteriochlorophyllide A dehydrogenase